MKGPVGYHRTPGTFNKRFVINNLPWYFSHSILREWGLALNTRVPLIHHTIGGGDPAGSGATETLFLAGYPYGLHLSARERAPGVRVSFFELTDLGRKVLQATRLPTDLVYLCQLQTHFRSKGLVAEIWPISAEWQNEGQLQRISETSVLCTVPESVAGTDDGEVGPWK